MSNVFLKEKEHYVRNIDMINEYVNQSSFYLNKMTNRGLEECRDFIKNGIINRRFKAINPTITFFERQDNGDSFKQECKLTDYFNNVTVNNEILVPTFTTYLNPSIKKSLLSGFTDNNVAKRSKAKKAAFKAEAEGNLELAIIRGNEQTNKKLFNNAMSGGFGTEGSILNNPTAHSTLTSMTRMESSIGNASNEKIIGGNRFYRTPNITIYDIINISKTINKEKLLNVMTKYKLHYPSISETIEVIKYSSDLYWNDNKAFKNIFDLVFKLSDLERAGFVYISDLFHIRKYNDSFTRILLTKLATKIINKEIPDTLTYIKQVDEQIVNYAHHICMSEVKGIGKDYNKLSLNNLNTLAATCENIINTLEDYKDFIDVFFLTDNMPLSAAYIPNMVRRSVVLSDTDSTMFSVDDYVTWYFGDLIFTDESYAIAASIMFIATQCIAHQLAIYSANINVEKEKLFKIAMKPEFTFPVFAQTSVAKHYYTCILVQEGNVFDKIKMEIKGVHLKNSAAPKDLVNKAHEKMKEILTKIMNNKKIKLSDEIKEVANLEREIIARLKQGDVNYYKRSKIKNPEAYSRTEEMSPYIHHLLWESVFEPKYNKIENPPYDVIKIPTIVNNITAVKKWLEDIEDKEFSARLGEWLAKYEKTCLPTIYMPLQYIKAYGIPKEISHVMNIKAITLELTIINRMILESLGYFPKEGYLLSEQGY